MNEAAPLEHHATVIDSPQSLASSIAERWYVVIVMCLVYAISIADRYVVSTVLEPIRLDLQLTDAGVGFLTGVPLGLFYVSFGIPMSWLADRKNRRNILAASLIVWSGFTALCGLSRNYWQFLAGRIGVGIGETGGTPPANSIIADYFPADRRPMALGVFALGAPIGAWLGADMAGAVAHAYGWRAAFLALGIPGVIMGTLIYLTIREPARGRLDAVPDTAAPPIAGVPALPVAPKGRISRGHGVGRMCPVGLGTDLVHTHLSHAQLRPQCRRSRRGHRSHSSGGRHRRDGRHRLDLVAPGHGRSAAGGVAAGGGRRIDHHSLVHRLLDPFPVDRQDRCSGCSFPPSTSTSDPAWD